MTTDPVPTLLDYQQKDFTTFLSQYQRGDTVCVCEWEPGLGKTLLAIMLAKALFAPKMLVIGPSISAVSWRKELAKWWPSMPALFVEAGKDIKKLKPHHRIVFVTVDLSKNETVRDILREWARGAFFVLDEAQYLRGASSQRTACNYGMGQGWLTHVWKGLLLSGTLIVSWPDDLWTHLARWMPERIVKDGQRLNYEQFRDYFLLTRQVPIPGAYQKRTQIYGMLPERQAELQERLRGFSIVRTKEESGLPPLTWQPLELELSASDRNNITAELMDNLPPALHDLARRSAAAPEDMVLAEQFHDALAQYTEYYGVALRILGVGKAKALSRYLKEKLDNNRAAYGVFSFNRKVMDIFDQELAKYGTARIDGSTSQNRRGEVVDRFMNPNGPRIFNGQIQACGTALTLVRADTCFFTQLSAIPGDNFQAASRFHRIGQQNPVTAFTAYVKGTLDHPMMAMLRKRTRISTAIRETNQGT